LQKLHKRRKKMKKRVSKIALVMSMAFIMLMSPAWAEEKKDALKALEDIKSALGMSIYLQGGYTYNFASPSPDVNALRIFDQEANSMLLDLAQLQFVKEPAVGGLGFKLKLSAGETAKYIHSNGLGDTSDPFDLTEAYISYTAPLGKGLRIDFGKFVTYFGAEVIEARDNVNYSRSLLFNYAIPFTHTGLKVSYPISDMFSGALYLVNGWDDTEDNNKGKSVGLSLGVTPMEQLSMLFNFMYGAEKPDNNHDQRFLFDWVATVKPMKNLSVGLNVDYATEQHSAPDGGEAKWYGWALTAKYDFNDWFSIGMRGEYFNDQDGVRTGTAQRAKEFTFTPQFVVAKNLLIRPEYRHDWSNMSVYPSSTSGETKKSQDTIALGVMYTW
jgi:hypothetical protein